MLAIIDQRPAAPEARACYEENTPPDVLDARRAWQEARRDGLRGRPTKKNRRAIAHLRGFFE